MTCAWGNQSICTGCGLCVKRCPMEALHLQDAPSVKGRKTAVTSKDGRLRELTNKAGQVAELNPERCIGCGVCAYKCPSQSLELARNHVDHNPPQSARDYLMQFMVDASPR